MEANTDRWEFKFIVPSSIVNPLQAKIGEWLERDAIAPEGYLIRSDYFDSDDRTSYWEKILGFPNRRRLRTRTYGTPNSGQELTRFIEIKHKSDGLTVKRRVLSSENDLQELIAGRIPFFSDKNGSRFREELVSLAESPLWRPVVRIQYQRTAFDSGRDGTIRITFDSLIQCCFPKYQEGDNPTPDLNILPPGDAIMEVKTVGPVPYWFRCLLGHFSLVPQSFSKYTIALNLYELHKNPI